MSHAVPLVDEYVALGTHFDTLVVHLGTNGLTSAGELDAIMRAAGRREVFFVTLRVPRVWEAPDNALLRALPDRWPNAHVIDWERDGTRTATASPPPTTGSLPTVFTLTAAGQRAYSTR